MNAMDVEMLQISVPIILLNVKVVTIEIVVEKKINGCGECTEFPCKNDMYSEHVPARLN
jgi:hypothetical protein